MTKKNWTKRELQAIRNVAPIIEKITYDVMLLFFRKQIRICPTEFHKSVYVLIKNEKVWNKIRDVQAQNRVNQMRHKLGTSKPSEISSEHLFRELP